MTVLPNVQTPDASGVRVLSHRPRIAVFAAVVLAHVLLLMLMPVDPLPRDRARVPTRPGPPMTVRFLPAPANVRSPVTVASSRAPGPSPSLVHSANRPLKPTARPLDAAQPDEAGAALQPLPIPGSASPVAPPALNLDLPLASRRSASSPDRPDRRIDFAALNRPKSSPEAAMNARLDLRVVEEPLGDGMRRIHQGDHCVLVHPSRAGGLDPFDRTHSQANGVEPCPK